MSVLKAVPNLVGNDDMIPSANPAVPSYFLACFCHCFVMFPLLGPFFFGAGESAVEALSGCTQP